MTIGDLIPGYIYKPGRSILQIDQPATVGRAGFKYCIPLDLPPAMSAPTPENAASAYSFVCATDPEAAAVIEGMKLRASVWSDVVAAQGLPQEISGPIVTPPTSPIAPIEAVEVSSSRN